MQVASGAFTGDINTPTVGWNLWDDPTLWQEFVDQVGTQPAIVHWFQDWHQEHRKYWDQSKVDLLTARGEVPMISWASRNPSTTAANDTTYNLASILAGNHDVYIDEWATEIADYGKPVLIGPMWEFNLSNYTWGIGVQGQTTTNFVQAWQYIVDRFNAIGAPNVKWVWTPHASGSTTTITNAYPGDSYVDYMGLDSFNNMEVDTLNWYTPSDLFSTYYNHLVTNVSTNKPFIIKETGCQEANGDKAAWLTALYDMVQNDFPKARAVLYFNNDRSAAGEKDWRVNSTQASLDSYISAIARVASRGTIEKDVRLVGKTSVSAGNQASITVTKPANLVEDDYLIILVGKGGGINVGTPSGLDLLAQTSELEDPADGGNMRLLVYGRRIDGTEPADWTFTANSGTPTWEGAALAYRGCLLEGSPVETILLDGVDTGVLAGGTISCPAVTPAQAGRRVVGVIYSRDTTAAALAALGWTTLFNEELEVTHSAAGSSAQTLGAAEHLTVDTSVVTPSASSTNAQVRHVAASIVLIPQPPLEALTETMRPDATTLVTNLTPNTDPAALAILQADPDDAGTPVFLEGTDPSGTSTDLLDQYAAAVSGTTPTGYAGQFTSPSNAVGSTSGNYATSSLASRNSLYGNIYTFGSLFSGIPDGSQILAIDAEVMSSASGTLVNEALAFVVGQSVVGSEGVQAAPTTDTLRTYVPEFMPDASQIKDSTFGVRVGATKNTNQSRTYQLDWVRVSVTYVGAGTTTPIEVRATMGNPAGSLVTGLDTGEIRLLARKKGSGENPNVNVNVVEGGSVVSSPISSRLVSSTTGAIIAGTFDQSAITDPTAVELRVLSSGKPGGLVEVGGLEWVADVAPPRTRMIPNAIIDSTGYTSPVLASIQDDPDSPDDNWWT